MTICHTFHHERLSRFLEGKGDLLVEAFSRNGLTIDLYQPRGIDSQTPHDRDEFYVIIKGQGTFKCEGKTCSFKEGDVLFVPAWTPHHFINFSGDLSAWVFFVGDILLKPKS